MYKYVNLCLTVRAKVINEKYVRTVVFAFFSNLAAIGKRFDALFTSFSPTQRVFLFFL